MAEPTPITPKTTPPTVSPSAPTKPPATPRPDPQAVRAAQLRHALENPFKVTHRDSRGGAKFHYITGGQAVQRLNDVLGVDGWEYEILEHGYDAEADEVWVIGQLTVYGPRRTVRRQQFGSQKHNRKRAQAGQPRGEILDTGFDWKGAATDALKKCATLYGVALYLASPAEEAAGWRPLPRADVGDDPEPEPDTEPRTIPPERVESASGENGVEVPTVPGDGGATSAVAAASVGVVAPDGAAPVAAAPTNPDAFPTSLADSEKLGAPAWQRDLADPELRKLLGAGYEQPKETDKRGLYISVSRNLGYTSAQVRTLLGIPTDEHLDAWLAAADTHIRNLYRVLKLHKERGVRLPTVAELQTPVAS